MSSVGFQEYLTICLGAFLASGLTLFSGFGLGTLLLPVMALFFSVDLAIALTAVVHALNNLFKCWLLGRYADRAAVLKFGLPAILAAFLGARVLLYLSDLQPLINYQVLGREAQVMPVKLVVAALMVVFALVELAPRPASLSLPPRYLPLGGVLSGSFRDLRAFARETGLPFFLVYFGYKIVSRHHAVPAPKFAHFLRQAAGSCTYKNYENYENYETLRPVHHIFWRAELQPA